LNNETGLDYPKTTKCICCYLIWRWTTSFTT